MSNYVGNISEIEDIANVQNIENLETVDVVDKAVIQSGDSPSIDAFGRWRVSNPQTLFDSKNVFNDPDLASNVENQPLFYDNQETSGGGSTAVSVEGSLVWRELL